MTGSSRGPNDPGRRDRIIDAALDVIAERGVEGTTHRRVAEAAEVPLGSMTYYFDGMKHLLVEAFTRLAESMSLRYRARLEAAGTIAEARAAVVEIICGPDLGSPRELVLCYELYAFASRNPEVLGITRSWMGASRASLSKHFDPRTARALDALVEGLSIHNSFDADPMPREDVAAVVAAISAGAGGGTDGG
ncbi:TetR family transcriptional regulator [Streptomyces sp. NPDC005840]|uniref:TetR family transcriptional regulator n=1 Tax=Streptomyces doudnae TaxID=3075536 RepID=A0ABD5EFJ3_9ACTN|nr:MULTISPECIES: TetR family transcriptional regulator [unclassified Streptomyces]MDT0433408.1 TetR family transcriptional regulator [Streptomyces sp. DSM 41981]MYQ66827.1 TetR family transcriptional regulator [Streptomyces sp. SID4950]SCE25892.1 transcriptional regulator, TetR family [Streptomyces sp. SolWspMP-5a-2]